MVDDRGLSRCLSGSSCQSECDKRYSPTLGPVFFFRERHIINVCACTTHCSCASLARQQIGIGYVIVSLSRQRKTQTRRFVGLIFSTNASQNFSILTTTEYFRASSRGSGEFSHATVARRDIYVDVYLWAVLYRRCSHALPP